MPEEKKETGFMDLPDEVLGIIIEYLALADLSNWMQVCLRFRQVGKDASYWKSLFPGQKLEKKQNYYDAAKGLYSGMSIFQAKEMVMRGEYVENERGVFMVVGDALKLPEFWKDNYYIAIEALRKYVAAGYSVLSKRLQESKDLLFQFPRLIAYWPAEMKTRALVLELLQQGVKPLPDFTIYLRHIKPFHDDAEVVRVARWSNRACVLEYEISERLREDAEFMRRLCLPDREEDIPRQPREIYEAVETKQKIDYLDFDLIEKHFGMST